MHFDNGNSATHLGFEAYQQMFVSVVSGYNVSCTHLFIFAANLAIRSWGGILEGFVICSVTAVCPLITEMCLIT